MYNQLKVRNIGHQIGMFIGAYVGGLVYDAMQSYSRMFYACFAVSIVGALASFLAKDASLREYHRSQNGKF